MLFKRRSAASTVFNKRTLWITGGYIGSQKTDTSEYVTLVNSSFTGSKIGPSLPKVLANHAMAKINGSYSIVVGGISSGISEETYFYNHQAEEWLDGPNLIQKRAWHGIGIVFDEEREESLIIVTGGHDFLNWIGSTEVLINNEWTSGKNSIQLMTLYFELKTSLTAPTLTPTFLRPWGAFTNYVCI